MRSHWKVLFFSAVLVTRVASADEWHYNQPVCGSQAIGLAGAFTAISDDTSAICYNPAGLSFITARKMTTSSSSFQTGKEIAIDSVSSGNTEFSFVGLKGFIGGMTTDPVLLPKLPVAIVIDIPRAEDSHSSLTFDAPAINVAGGKISNTATSLDRVVQVGTAIRPIPDWSFGTTIGLQNSTRRVTQHTEGMLSNLELSLLASESRHITTDFWFFLYKIGALYQANENLKLGVTLSYGTPLKQTQAIETDALVVIINSTTSSSGTYSSTSSKVTHINEDSGYGYSRLPFKTRVGAGYRLAPEWRLSADVQHVIPSRTEFEGKEGVEPKVDAALGLMTTSIRPLKLLFGLLTQRDTRRPVSSDTATRNSGAHIDEYGATFLASIMDETSEYAAGIYVTEGKGSGEVLNANETAIVRDLKRSSYQLTVSLTTTL